VNLGLERSGKDGTRFHTHQQMEKHEANLDSLTSFSQISPNRFLRASKLLNESHKTETAAKRSNVINGDPKIESGIRLVEVGGVWYQARCRWKDPTLSSFQERLRTMKDFIQSEEFF